MERSSRRRILCAVDDSERAQEAIAVAGDLARRLEMPLTLVHVVEEPAGFAFDHAGTMELERRGRLARGAALLDDLAQASDLPPDTERRVESGNPGGTLRTLAAELSVAAIIVASRGRGRVRSVLFGSVTSQLGDLPCPLLVVPPEGAAQYRRAVDGVKPMLLCGIDGMTESHHVIGEADWLASELRSRLLIIYADMPGVPVPSVGGVGLASTPGLEEERQQEHDHAVRRELERSRNLATLTPDVDLRAVRTDLAATLAELEEPSVQMIAITFDSPWQRVAAEAGCPVLVVS